MSPREIFDSKIENVRKVVSFRGRQLSAEELEDVQAEAALQLWRQCLKLVPNINAAVIAQTAYSIFYRKRSKLPTMAVRDDVAARGEACITMGHGQAYTLDDARIDAPESFTTATHGITTTEVAKRLGVTRQRVHQIKDELGAVKLGGRWRFPAEAGLYPKR